MIKTENIASEIEQAWLLFSNGKLPLAMEIIERVLRYFPECAEAFSAGGVISFAMSDLLRARTFFERALALRPSDKVGRINLAGLLLKQRQWADARRLILEGLKLLPDDTDFAGLLQTLRERTQLERFPMGVFNIDDILVKKDDYQPVEAGGGGFAVSLKMALAEQGVVLNSARIQAMLIMHGAVPFGTPPPSTQGLYKMIWLYSRPDSITPWHLVFFDKIFCFSPGYVRKLNRQGIEAEVLLAGARRRAPATLPPLQHGLVFIGDAGSNANICGIMRDVLILGSQWHACLEVFGSGWEGLLPAKCLRGPVPPDNQLADLYTSSAVVLCEHSSDMLREGFPNLRIPDIMSAGGVPLSEKLSGAHELFNGALPTYSGLEELERRLEELTAAGASRDAFCRRGIQVAEKFRNEFAARRIAEELLVLNEDKLRANASAALVWTGLDPRKGFHEGCEARVIRRRGLVHKLYKPVYAEYNERFYRRGEIYYLTHYKSTFFPHFVRSGRDYLIMKDHGVSIGFIDESGRQRLYPEGLDYLELVKWLAALRHELRRLGLRHRDIHPVNILYDASTNKYTLIDLGWMIKSDDPDSPEGKGTHFCTYAATDEEAIDKLSAEAVNALVARLPGSQQNNPQNATPNGRDCGLSLN